MGPHWRFCPTLVPSLPLKHANLRKVKTLPWAQSEHEERARRSEQERAEACLVQEISMDNMRVQLQRERERFAAMEGVRLAEREELVRSYEAMLLEQARLSIPALQHHSSPETRAPFTGGRGAATRGEGQQPGLHEQPGDRAVSGA